MVRTTDISVGMLSKTSLVRICRFGVVGLASTATHLGVAWVCIGLVGSSYQLGNSFAFFCSFVVSFLGNHLWTFVGHQEGSFAAFVKYALMALLGISYNILCVHIAVVALEFGYVNGLTWIVLTWPAISFLVSKSWVFASCTGRAT